MNSAYSTLLEEFLESEDFEKGVRFSTSEQGNSGKDYLLLLYPDLHYEIRDPSNEGKLIGFEGISLGIPGIDQNQLLAAINAGDDDDEYFDIAFAMEEEDLKNEMRRALKTFK